VSTNLTIRWLDTKTKGAAYSGKFPLGITSGEVLDRLGIPKADVAAVYVNNEILSLTAPLVVNAVLRPVSFAAHQGRVIYRASLAFLLGAAARVFPGRHLIVGHSLGNGYYYHFADGAPASTEEIDRLKTTMASLVESNFAITFHYMAYEEALALFQENGQADTVMLLEGRIAAKVPVYECDGWFDLAIGALVPETGALRVFDIFPYEDGFLLRYPQHPQAASSAPLKTAPNCLPFTANTRSGDASFGCTRRENSTASRPRAP
jgi:uridine kinase